MEAVKKKMNNLKLTLEEAEEKASKAERELQQANERADAVSDRPSVVSFPHFGAICLEKCRVNFLARCSLCIWCDIFCYFPCVLGV